MDAADHLLSLSSLLTCLLLLLFASFSLPSANLCAQHHLSARVGCWWWSTGIALHPSLSILPNHRLDQHTHTVPPIHSARPTTNRPPRMGAVKRCPVDFIFDRIIGEGSFSVVRLTH